MRKIFTTLSLLIASNFALANPVPADSTLSYTIDGVEVRASAKETSSTLEIPSAVTFIGSQILETHNIQNVNQISSLAPNVFIADYGSPLSAPIYIRGIGTRGSGQSVAIYVDGAPLLNKSLFDMERIGISSIEVLRGPQGTLYGRNAMGGVINIQTKSPLDYQGLTFRVGGGAYGRLNLNANASFKATENLGISLTAYLNSTDGYFTNEFTGRSVDNRDNAGVSLKLDWALSSLWRAEFTTSMDITQGGAFAYGQYNKETGEISKANFNDKSTYDRSSVLSSLRFSRLGEDVLFSSTTSFEWLGDDMWMDQDFSPLSLFTLNQRQNHNAVSQEFAWRSVNDSKIEWSAGLFGFYDALQTDATVTFGADGVQNILQSVFDGLAAVPNAPTITITDNTIPNPGRYNTPAWGAAAFAQGTLNDLFTEGLSLTVGARVDYEKQYIDYNSAIGMNLLVTPPYPGAPSIPMAIDTTLIGSRSQESLQILPKASLRYECSENISTWITASKGYKAGGYNIQMFSDIAQSALQEGYNPSATSVDLDKTISYSPEITWNYEVGTRAELFDRVVSMEAALFYMDITDVQLTEFVSGGGRILSNAGAAESYGIEVSTTIRPLAERTKLRFDLNYGYNNATFTSYNDGIFDYSGNHIPYTPQHTFSASGLYNMPVYGWFKNIAFSASYNGAGKIYWNEANDVYQDFYGVLNAKVSLQNRLVSIDFWANNLLNTEYGAFYFESFGESFIQQGLPLTVGVDLILKF